MDPQLAELIRQTAQSLGIDPIDLGTAISYETGGTFDPLKSGPHTQWGTHRGLIQFGEPQAKQFGVDWNNPVQSQLGPDGAVAKYLRSTGVKPGMGMLDLYSAINAGGVGPKYYGRSDANNGGAPGTVADKVNNQMAAHRKNAYSMFGMPDGPKGQESYTAPGAVIPGEPGVDVPAGPEGPEQSPLGKMMAGFASGFGGMGGGGGAADAGAPRVIQDGGFGATMAAQQGAEQAKQLAFTMSPDIEKLLALAPKPFARKPAGPVVVG